MSAFGSAQDNNCAITTATSISQADLKQQYERYENIIKLEKDSELPVVFQKLISEIEDATNGKLVDRQHIQMLFGNYLPKYIKTLLSKRYLQIESERQILVTTFINQWLRLRVPALLKYLSQGTTTDPLFIELGISRELEIIEAIFNGDNEIYNYRTSKNSPEIEDRLSKLYEELQASVILENQDQRMNEIDTSSLEVKEDTSNHKFEVAKVKRPNFSSYYLVHNVNVFSLFGGFELLHLLVNKGHQLQQNKLAQNGVSMFKVCLSVLTILGQIKSFLIDSFWLKGDCYGQTITNACTEFIKHRCTGEDLRIATKKDIIFFSSNLESLLDSITLNLSNDEKINSVYMISETIELDIALRCLRIPILEKKLVGFQIILQQIFKVRSGNKQNSGSSGVALRQGPLSLNLQGVGPKRWLNTERLLGWFDKNKIFDLIFGDSLHSECIKKSYSILEFLYINGKIQRREIDKMWECATKKHEAYKVGILKALAFLATKAKIEDLKYLFNKLKTIPITEVDKFCLDMMKSIAKKLTGDEVNFNSSPMRRPNFRSTQNGVIGAALPPGFQRSNSSDGHVKQVNAPLSGLIRGGSLSNLIDNPTTTIATAATIAPQDNINIDRQMMHENDMNANSTFKKVKAGETPPSDQKHKRNKSSSPPSNHTRVNFGFEEQKEGNFDLRGQGFRNLNNNYQGVGQRRQMNQDLNPLEVPADKEDKKTADEDISFGDANHEENGFGEAELFNTSFREENNYQQESQLQKKNQMIEEEKGQDNNGDDSGDRETIIINVNIMLQNQTLGLEDPDYRSLATQVIEYYWNLCQESTVSQQGLSFQVHKLAIEDLANLLINNYSKSILHFIGRCVSFLLNHQSIMSMQNLLHKLLANIHFPLDQTLKGGLPKNRQELISILDEEINLANVCLSSYIEFKRLSLAHIFEQMGSQEHEQENLETQSSLDNDDERSSSTTGQVAGGNQPMDINRYQQDQQREHIIIHEDGITNQSSNSIFVSPRMRAEEEFKVPKNIRTQSFREEGSTPGLSLPKSISNPGNGSQNAELIFAQDSSQNRLQIIGGTTVLGMTQSAQNPRIINSQSKKNRQTEGLMNQARQDQINENAVGIANNQAPVNNNTVSRDFLNDLVTNEVYHYTYYQELHYRLDFLKFLVGSSPSILKPQQIQILWECLVINAFYERERDQFFNWCTQILKTSLSLPSTKPKNSDEIASDSIFNDDCLELLFFETLLKLDFRYITEVMYECFERYFIYINEQYGQIVTSSAFESAFEVHETKLIGVEALWEILLCARNNKVYKSATEFLHKLYKKMSPALVEKLNEIKEDLLVTCMDQIKTGYTHIRQELGSMDPYEMPLYQLSQSFEDPKNRIARSISQLCKFIDEFEGLRDKNGKGASHVDKEILIKGMNQISSNPSPKTVNLTRPLSTKIGSIREEIANAVFPKKTAKEINLMHRGKDLNEDLKTLKDLLGTSTDQQIILMISLRSQFELDLDTMKEDHAQNDELINEAVSNVKSFMGDIELSDEVLKLAAKKCNLDLNEIMMMILDEDKVNDLQDEVRRNEEAQQSHNIVLLEDNKDEGNNPNEEAKLNLIISNRSEYFDLLFELLNLGINEITNAAWNLLIQIPVNKTLLNQIRTLSSIQIGGQQNWCFIIDPSNSYKLLYSIQIVNSLISVNNEKLSEAEIQERYEWRLRFLELGGFEHLYNILITSDPDEYLGSQSSAHALRSLMNGGGQGSTKKKAKSGQQPAMRLGGIRPQNEVTQSSEEKKDSMDIKNNQAKCLGYLISIVKIFIQASLLTNDEGKLLTLINQSSTSPYRKPKTMKSVLQSVPESKFGQIMFGQGAGSGPSGSASDGDNSSIHTPKFQSSNDSTPQGYQTPNPNEGNPQDKNGKDQNKSIDTIRAETIFSQQTGGVKANEIQLYTQIDDFPRLVDQISGPIAQNLLEKVVNFNGLISKLLNIIYKAVMFCDSPEVSSLVQNSLDLLLPCIVWKPKLLIKEIYEFENLESLLIQTLFHNSNENVRRSIERTFKIICNEGAAFETKNQLSRDDEAMGNPGQEAQPIRMIPPKVYILKILLQNLPDTSDKSDNCEEYFNLITYLMKQCQQNFKFNLEQDLNSDPISAHILKKRLIKEDGLSFSAYNLFQWCIYSLRNRPTYEDRYSSFTDKILAGYLQLTQSLLEINSDLKKLTIQGHFDLIKIIFDFLFLLPSMEEQQSKMKTMLQKSSTIIMASGDAHPKCKKKLTRKRAFNLLITLCQQQENNFVQLLQELYDFHRQIEQSQKVVSYQDFDNEVGMRSASGYVGLKNFGCTCYMNALIQQLFMIPEFRKGILESDVNDPDLENNVLYQMKLIFANLQESEKQYYTPLGFTKAFKFYGEPVNVRQQQDTNEFCSMLFDNLENLLKGTPLANHLKDTIGGIIGNETKSMEEEFPYVGEREEPFFAIQLDIKNKKSLGEALDLFIKPDHLDGENKYMCEKHDRKIDAQRRSYLKKLQNTVIINLKRFDFDYNTFQRLKLNDFCEFPEKINFKPWTKEGILDRERQLKKNQQVLDPHPLPAGTSDILSHSEGNANKKNNAAYEDGSVEDLVSSSHSDNEDIDNDEEMIDVAAADADAQSEDGVELEEMISNGGAGAGESAEEDEENMNLDTAGKYFDVGVMEDFIDIQEDEIQTDSSKRHKTKKPGNTNVKKSGALTPQVENSSKQADKDMKTSKSKKISALKISQSRNKKVFKDDSYYQYELVGVLVHSGSADAGHYYSFIKDRTPGSKRWLEFNDIYVREFDSKNLGTECFGGDNNQNRGGPSIGGMLDDFSPADARMFERCRNAYLLFYERINPIQKEEPMSLITQVNKKLINGIESSIYQRIWEENAAFMKLKLFFDQEYFQFTREYINLHSFENILFFDKDKSSTFKYKSLLDLTNNYINSQASNPDVDPKLVRDTFIADQIQISSDSQLSDDFDIFSPGVKSHMTIKDRIKQDPGLYALKLATILSQDIILKVKDVQSFVQWLQLMESLYERNAVACVWLIKYLTENKKLVDDLLLESQYFEVRESFAKLLTTAISVVAKNEESYMFQSDDVLVASNLDKPQADHQISRVSISRSAVIRFMELFFNEKMLDYTLRQNWRRFDEYFQVLGFFAQIGFSEMKYLVHNQNAIIKLLEFVMNSLSPFTSMKPRMGDKIQEANFTQPVDVLAILIRGCFTPGIKEQGQYSPESLFQTDDKHIDIPFDKDYMNFPLFSPECFTNDLLVKATPQNDSLMKIIIHLSWGDLNASTFFLNEIMTVVRNRRSIKDLTYHVKILSNLMRLTDDLQYQRLNLIFQFREPDEEGQSNTFGAMPQISNANQVPKIGFFKFLDSLQVNYAYYVFEILHFFGEQAIIYDQTGTVLNYMRDNKEYYQTWVQRFLIQYIYTKNKFTENQSKVDQMNACIEYYKQIFGEEVINAQFGSAFSDPALFENQEDIVNHAQHNDSFQMDLGGQQAENNQEKNDQASNFQDIKMTDSYPNQNDPFGDDFDQ